MHLGKFQFYILYIPISEVRIFPYNLMVYLLMLFYGGIACMNTNVSTIIYSVLHSLQFVTNIF